MCTKSAESVGLNFLESASTPHQSGVPQLLS